ncbi:nucleotidyltransferase domain-containing protein [Thiococcus pfennigii]|uniref:nucleotidyltransferase domain-containing protein n=1 Tax=Thiococcus pfennigii TaxID=1057 RepID=UPI0019034446|nr:hypothetical protein [Thiococcus pfennigii]
MAGDDLRFGLSRRIREDLSGVFAGYPEIERVLIFGSRADGTFKDESDIDLAIVAPTMSSQRFSQLWGAIDALSILFKIDLLHWDRLTDEPLKVKILTRGHRFF